MAQRYGLQQLALQDSNPRIHQCKSASEPGMGAKSRANWRTAQRVEPRSRLRAAQRRCKAYPLYGGFALLARNQRLSPLRQVVGRVQIPEQHSELGTTHGIER